MAYNTGTSPTLAELITAAFIPQVFSREVIMHTKSALVCANAVNKQWRKYLVKGYTVSIPVISEASTNEVTPGTRTTAQNLAGTPVTITVDQWREATAQISDMSEIEQLANYMTNAEKSCGYAVAKYIDTTIGAKFSTLSSSSVYGDDGQTFTDELVVAIREGLRQADVPNPEMWHIIGDPSTERDIYDQEKLINRNYGAGEVVSTGEIGKIYGMKTLITNNLTAATTGNYGVIMHPDAIGLVAQEQPRSQLARLNDEFMTKIVVDAIWGVGEVRDTFGRAFYTRYDG